MYRLIQNKYADVFKNNSLNVSEQCHTISIYRKPIAFNIVVGVSYNMLS